MTVNPFVFSNNPRYRLARHSLFWLLWICYYTAYRTLFWHHEYPLSRSFPASLVEVVLATPLDMVFCYSIFYYLLPGYLYKGRYLSMMLLWILFSLLFVGSFYSYTQYIVPIIRQLYGMPPPRPARNLYWLFLDLFYQVNLEGCLAVSIKLGKMWVIKQEELDLIKSEKQRMEPHLQEGEMQPVFLLDAFDRIERLSVIKPALIPGVIKRVRSLLLYVIYDNNQPSVSLEKELMLLEEYVELEKTGMGDNLLVSVKIIGNMKDERIAPFILLPLVENGFRQLSQLNLSEKSIDLEVRVNDGDFRMKVGWSKPTDSSTLAIGGSLSLQSIGKRLNLLYPQSHDLRVVITSEQFSTYLKMDLRRAIN
jgi:two-component system, LytTR family, sensor kinase